MPDPLDFTRGIACRGSCGRRGLPYRYVSDDSKCVACGFCADTCPCGIWTMRPF
ncbi:4Fe-4S binding protein [Candidatus Electronema sp. PJ]|uniref:4Fe-4S binding protein n=1 Tax=Candidatus Electronema sp. PJ TaxID=3401572 RepID=UPI003AA89824